MKRFLLFLGLVLLFSGCSVFRVPRAKPTHYDEAWASQMVRDANKADQAEIDRNVKKGRDQK